MQTRTVRAALALTFVVAALEPALAQSRGDYPLTVQPESGYGPGTPVDALPTPFSHGGSCVKMCDVDDTPCDPDYWKVADRRCNLNQRG